MDTYLTFPCEIVPILYFLHSHHVVFKEVAKLRASTTSENSQSNPKGRGSDIQQQDFNRRDSELSFDDETPFTDPSMQADNVPEVDHDQSLRHTGVYKQISIKHVQQ